MNPEALQTAKPPRAAALEAVAMGALALGATAIGALAIGALSLRRLRLLDARLRLGTLDHLQADLQPDPLTVSRPELPPQRPARARPSPEDKSSTYART